MESEAAPVLNTEADPTSLATESEQADMEKKMEDTAVDPTARTRDVITALLGVVEEGPEEEVAAAAHSSLASLATLDPAGLVAEWLAALQSASPPGRSRLVETLASLAAGLQLDSAELHHRALLGQAVAALLEQMKEGRTGVERALVGLADNYMDKVSNI